MKIMNEKQINDFIAVCESMTIVTEGVNSNDFKSIIKNFFIALLNKIKSLYAKFANKTMINKDSLSGFIKILDRVIKSMSNIEKSSDLVEDFDAIIDEIDEIEDDADKLKGKAKTNTNYVLCSSKIIDQFYATVSKCEDVEANLYDEFSRKNLIAAPPSYGVKVNKLLTKIMTLSDKLTSLFISLQYKKDKDNNDE